MAENSHVDKRVYQSKIKGVTKGKLFNLNYEWKIDDVNIVGKKRTEYLSSEIFWSPNNTDIKWQLILYPKGKYTHDNNMSIELRFHPSFNYREIEADYKISILDKEKKNVCCKHNTYIFTYRDSYTCFTYQHYGNILQHENYVPNGCLTLVCEISYCTDIVNLPNQIDEIPNFIDPGFDKLQSGYKALFDSQTLNDVTFSVSGQELRAHKAILAAHSQVFVAMFDNDMKEKLDGRVDIDDVEFNIFHKMLRYIYTGEVEMTDYATVNGLMVVADKYNIETLKIECEQYFCKNINVDNVIVLFRLADQYNASYLKKYTLKFMYREKLISQNIIGLSEIMGPDALAEYIRVSILETEANWVDRKKFSLKTCLCIATGVAMSSVAIAFFIKKMISSSNQELVTTFPTPQIDSLIAQIDFPILQNNNVINFPKIESVNPFEFFKKALG